MPNLPIDSSEKVLTWGRRSVQNSRRNADVVYERSPTPIAQGFRSSFLQTLLTHPKTTLYWTSMTQLLMHSVTQSSMPSFRPKTSNQLIKKSCSHLSKSHQNVQNSDFQSQFCKSKIIQIFLFFFH